MVLDADEKALAHAWFGQARDQYMQLLGPAIGVVIESTDKRCSIGVAVSPAFVLLAQLLLSEAVFVFRCEGEQSESLH